MAADSDGGSSEPNINDSATNRQLNDDSVTTIVTCEGDYYDPEFHDKFKQTLGKLENILCDEPRKQSVLKNSPCRTTDSSESENLQTNSENSGLLKISKLEPWNSVRVTLSIPREAAARLRQMANEGSAQLRQLGILSVQVEGDQVISLRIASRFGNENDTQEIVLNTTGGTSGPPIANTSSTLTTISTSVTVDSEQQSSASNNQINRFLHASSSSSSTTNQQTIPSKNPLSNGTKNNEFRSPNVVCPSDTQVPIKATTVTSNLVQTNVAGRAHEPLNRPFPFASMQQAAIAIQNRSQQQDFHNFTANNRTAVQQNIVAPTNVGTSSQPTVISGNTYTQQQTAPPPPPPPYPTKVATNIQQSITTSGQNIAISSPLLVNLLQNEGASQNQKNDKTCKPVKVPVINNKPPIIQNVGSNPTGFVKANEINRIPPLPQTSSTSNNILGTSYDSPVVANTVQTVQNVQTPSSTTVPSTPHIINKKLPQIPPTTPQQQPQRPNTIIVPPNTSTVVPQQPVPNPRLQQTQQLRNLQQQLIQQQQSRLLNQKLQQNTSPVRAAVAQNYRTPSTIVTPSGTAPFNSNQVINNLVPQPPPYPGNRSIPQQNNIRTSPSFHQNRFNQFSSTNVPDNVLSFGQSLATNTNLQPIAQPMPHLGLVNQLNLDSSLSNITPSLTDLSKTDLDSLLPTLTDLDGTDLISDIAKDIVDNFDIDTAPSTIESTPIEIPDELNSKGKKRLFLINPSNGQLEPMPSESSSSEESDTEEGEIKKNRKKGIMDVFSELNEQSNSIYSDDDTNSTATSKRGGFGGDNTDQSDSENKLSESSSTKSHRQKNYVKGRRESPNILKSGKTVKEKTPTEKIKLRLKLEKNEPVNTAYKVDVSFVNRQEPKRANTSPTLKTIPSSSTSPGCANFTTNMSGMTTNNMTEEPRVPPLHISLRGRNSVVISNKSSKKHLLKSGSETESCDEKQSKKSKIRKDKDGVKLKNRLYKEISGKNNHDYENELKIKTKSDLDDIATMSSYQREPGEIVMPNLKVLDSKSKTSKKLIAPTSLTSNSSSSIKPGDGNIEKTDLLSNDFKNHKKKSECLNKLNFKSKFDKNKSKLDQIDMKKIEEIKSMNLKRVHSSPPATGSTSSYLTEIPVSMNGLINSPDIKKRKLSDSLLG